MGLRAPAGHCVPGREEPMDRGHQDLSGCGGMWGRAGVGFRRDPCDPSDSLFCRDENHESGCALHGRKKFSQNDQRAGPAFQAGHIHHHAPCMIAHPISPIRRLSDGNIDIKQLDYRKSKQLRTYHCHKP